MKERIGLSNDILENVTGGSRIEEAAAASAAEINAICADVAARIIACAEALNARQEVRITMQNAILKGTEVFISKDGKQLGIRFVTYSHESCDILQQNLGQLREQLMRTLQQDCVVIV